MANPTSNYVYALPHTATDEAVEVLLVKRHRIQTRVDGRSHRGIVPNWAGQWGLISARPLVSQSMEQTVQGAVLAQTGIDLSDAASAERYRIVGAEPRTLKDADNKSVAVLFLTFLPEGLREFAADAAGNIAAGKVRDGVIDNLQVEPVSSALALIGPGAPPPEGQPAFPSSSRPPRHALGRLGSGSAALAGQLAERAAMIPTGHRLAVETLAGCLGGQHSPTPQAPTEGLRLVELSIHGARRHDSGQWYQTYAPGQVVHIQAVTYPSSAADATPFEWQGGEPDPLGRLGWRTLPLDRLSAPGSPFAVRAILGTDALEARIAVIPDLIGVEVTRAHAQRGVRAESDPVPYGATWVRAVLSPATADAFRYLNWYGGTIDPSHPLDRRLVSIKDIAAAGKAMAVELDLGLR